MKQLLVGLTQIQEANPEKFGDLKISESAQSAVELMESIEQESPVNEVVANAIELLWKEKAIKATFDQRATLKVEDSSEYFFSEVQRIGKKDYSPNNADIIRVRYRTTGVTEQKMEIHGHTFHIFDVGGQRSERKKWIHCFEFVQAVLFVASLSAYNETMYEDEDCNSMADSLTLFEEICNSPWFTNTSMILFLNKQDEFAKRIQNFPLKICFPEYKDENLYEPCLDYIKLQYQNKNQSKEKKIYIHVTVATDRNNVERVFGDVQQILIDNNLKTGGLVHSAV